MRINKFLAQCNLGSRRDVEKLILQGEIKVNDMICKELSAQIDPKKDKVEYQNKVLSFSSEHIYIMLNKPKGYLVSHKDDFERKTVYDLLPKFNAHLFAIGRLDYQTEGLLLLTTDGEFANKIIHPRYKLPKVYKVKAKGLISDTMLDRLRNGVKIQTGKTQPAKVYYKSRNNKETNLRITIKEGKKRQIRRMIEQVDSEVIDLKRIQIGSLKLDKLPIGMWRVLTTHEIKSLLKYQDKGK